MPVHSVCFGHLGGVKSTEGVVKPADKGAEVAQHLIANGLQDNPFCVTPLASPEAIWGLNTCVLLLVRKHT